ncbi:MAG TPA: isoprenylcysteine carboxylmethyltransferase family protein [Candidatus Acidoferrales bacterium]|nr:isoprenylcysteine carboxylmethyltransferase family protein [Candidatus Acidoferrales bacterium]
MKTLIIALRAVVYMTGFVLFWGWMALRVRSLDRNLGIILPAWTGFLGVILGMLGGILALVCAGAFIVRGRGTPAPFDAPREFVAVGPYRYVRNPMYIGGLTAIAGFALYLHSVSILLLCLVVFLLVHLFVLFYEEPALRAKFGAGYEAYCRTVSRWVPSLTNPRRDQ